ncbi:hypothetical protein QOZ83_05590 [Romboutsia sedimentorum]|uniref:hypothetical protein n=1 Tax=Romboutsia sedimentorum TaxID=1368474 RepID=UPI0024DEFDDE|nr:hypothetical protein [Romboutsia sedimentorum]MDK2585330.1 hypothetical protein [Romboutsia sedimentorum]
MNNKIELFENVIETEDELTASLYLIDIYKEDYRNFRKKILLSGILPEPLAFDIGKYTDKIDKFYRVAKKSKAIVIINGYDYKNDFIIQINNILKIYEIIQNHQFSNEKAFKTCKFLKYSKERQIQMICLFIEDQMNLAQIENLKQVKKNDKAYTGMESSIPLNVENNDTYRMSSTDNLEAYINAAEEMIRYIFYIHKNDMPNIVTNLQIDANPYYNPEFEMIMNLSSHRTTLKEIWDRAKYRNWGLILNKDEKNNKIYYFRPEDIDRYKKERASTERSAYSDTQRLMKGMTISNIINTTMFNKINDLKIDKVIDVFSMNVNVIKDIFNSIDLSMKEYLYFINLFYGDKLLNTTVKENITFYMLIDTIKYLYSIAMISGTIPKGQKKFNNENEYLDIAPIIDTEIMATQLSTILKISPKLARDCLNIFIFKPNDQIMNLDLFSQPLVYISEEQIIFTPILILQMNVERVIEKVLSKTDNNLSDKGTNMENYMKKCISKSPYVEVNKSDIKFMAYDGRYVEFDFLGVFEGKLLLIEMKCRTTPYSSKEIMDKEGVLKEVVDQVNRRVNVIQNNWDEIKKRSTIKLMDKPPEEKDIIKIGCFNFINFTSINIDGVYISDCSSIVKYFTDPINYMIVAEKSNITKYPVENLWGGTSPSVDNFEKFLQMPNMLKIFYDKMDCLYKPLPLINEEDNKLAFLDCYMSENPFIKYKPKNIKQIDNKLRSSKNKNKRKNKKHSKKSKKKNRGR